MRALPFGFAPPPPSWVRGPLGVQARGLESDKHVETTAYALDLDAIHTASSRSSSEYEE
ncbi:MAG: hypothetical protein U0414_30420 [Polyangiaceae bacterium]